MPTALAVETVTAITRRLAPKFNSSSALANAVLEQLGDDPEDLRHALRQVLPSYVSAVIRNDRNDAINARNEPDPTPEPEPEPQDLDEDEEDVVEIEETPVPSSKSDRIRARFQNILTSQLPTEHGYRLIGECTASDLLFAAELRYSTAAKTHARGKQYERLANAVLEYGARTVADLPEQVVLAAYNGTQ